MTRNMGQDDHAHLLYSLQFSQVEACTDISNHRHEVENTHTHTHTQRINTFAFA